MTSLASYRQPPEPAFLFDLDGTLIDSVYQHVIAWRHALSRLDIDLSVWRIHRRIGMSGGLFVSALMRETGVSLSESDIDLLQEAHAAEYLAQADSIRPLPGAARLLAALTARQVPWMIATSSRLATARLALPLLGLPEDTVLVTRDMVHRAKPDPDLFLAAAALLGVEPRDAMVVGDSVWDLLAARRAGSLGIGLMSGGYGREELERAGAYRVYTDPAELLARADELGVRDLAAGPGPGNPAPRWPATPVASGPGGQRPRQRRARDSPRAARKPAAPAPRGRRGRPAGPARHAAPPAPARSPGTAGPEA